MAIVPEIGLLLLRWVRSVRSSEYMLWADNPMYTYPASPWRRFRKREQARDAVEVGRRPALRAGMPAVYNKASE